MRLRSLLSATVVAAASLSTLALTGPVPEGCKEIGTSAPGDEGRFACTEVTYFHCAGTTKVANLHQAQDGTLPSWDTNRPTASVTSGAGCGWVDNSAFRSTQAGNSAHDGAWKGTFTGNLTSLTVRAHSISVGPGRAGEPQTFRVSLFVDGVSMFGLAADGRANRADVTLTPVPSSTQLSSLYEFTVTGLPFGTELGKGTTGREVILNLAAGSEPVMGWVYDTTEVDSGITFNPATFAATRVVATP